MAAHALFRRLCFGLVGVFALSSVSLSADTFVSGTISSNTTWTTAASPYVVTGDVTVAAGVTLTVQAGATVKFNSGRALNVNGTLLAVGSSGSGIVFTANTASPSRGFWANLVFNSTAGASQIAYVTVSYGGSWLNTAVLIQGCSPVIDHLTINQSGTDAIEVKTAGANVTMTNSTVSNNSWSGFVVYGGGALTLTSATATANGDGIYVGTGGTLNVNGATLTNNASWAIGAEHDTALTGLTTVTMSGNGGGAHNAIDYRGGTIAGNERWSPGVERWVNVTTSVATAGVLTIDPGVTVRTATDCSIEISGKLMAQGTLASPILMTGQTATPGAWSGLGFQSGANPSASVISYLTESYGGSTFNNWGGLRVIGSSPTFDHVTVSGSPYDGVQLLSGANPTIQNSSITSNARHGLEVWANSGSSLTLNNTSFTSNAWYAMLIDPSTALSGLAGLSASSNGGNAIGIRTGTISVSRTWHMSAIPYAVTSNVAIGNGATLTIEPGTTVKFTYHAGTMTIQSGGVLNAVGTLAAPIVLTSEAASPAPSDWGPIYFNPGSSPLSRIAYANVSYGGAADSNYAAIQIDGSSPTLDHVSFLNSGYSAVSYVGAGGAPSISNCSFVGTASGVLNYTATVITARFNYWNNSSGPSGSGSGTGAYVTGGVLFDPWLTATPSTPDWFNAGTVGNRTLNPSIGINQVLTFGTIASGNWTASWKDSGGNTIRTIAGSGATGSATWDGKNDSGVAQPNGTYSYLVSSTSTGGDVATPIRGVAIINNALAFTLTAPVVSQAFFSPNADGVQDTTAVTSTASFDGVTWTVNVINSGSTTVRSYAGSGPAVAFTWDGKNGSGVLQPDGLYTLQILANDGTASTNASGSTTLDNTLPTVTITAPTSSATLSNVYQNGIDAIAITGSSLDTNFTHWELEYNAGGAWLYLASSSSQQTNGTYLAWPTLTVANGTYSLRVWATDKAGNKTTTVVSPLTVANLRISSSSDIVTPPSSYTLTSIIPFPLKETLLLKAEDNSTAVTLVDGTATRAAGTYNDTVSALSVKDGFYYWTVSVTDGSHTMTIDNSLVMDGRYTTTNSMNPTSYDPFNNAPTTLTYGVPFNSKVTIIASPVIECYTCATPGQMCSLTNQYQARGTQTYKWTGADPTGAFRTGFMRIGAIFDATTTPANGVVVYGNRPTITSLSAQPPLLRPTSGSQVIGFTLGTTNSRTATVVVTLINQSSTSVLKTFTLSNQAAGAISVTWDGYADNGALVAPGGYTVNVAVTDSAGNLAQQRVLTTVQY